MFRNVSVRAARDWRRAARPVDDLVERLGRRAGQQQPVNWA
jgi:hypothetical protein